jgi:hypothetical protein
MPYKDCLGCGINTYVSDYGPAFCIDCTICPHCRSYNSFVCGEDLKIHECVWCKHNFPSLKDLEGDVRKYWVNKAKRILGLS